MTEAQEAKQSWERSAQAWIDRMDSGDLGRVHLIDPAMLAAAGDVRGLEVVDIGCGEGRFARMLAQKGAKVTALEFTPSLLKVAAERDPADKYIHGTAEALPLASNAFDLAINYLVLIDVPDFRTAIGEMARVLKPEGKALVANLNSFVTTALGWIRDQEGRQIHFPVDNYATEHAQRVSWAGISIVNWHRPFSAYVTAFLDAGLILRSFEELVPTEELAREVPYLEDELRVPHFHVMVWQKPGP